MNVINITAENKKPKEMIRLAAYCRVSSDSEDQLHSFATQIRQYKDYEKKHPQYKLVDIYADEGLTGTCLEKRDEQKRLIRDGKRVKLIGSSSSRYPGLPVAPRNCLQCSGRSRRPESASTSRSRTSIPTN